MDRSALKDDSTKFAFKNLWVETHLFDSHCKRFFWSTNWSFQRSQFAVVLSLLRPSVSGILRLSCGERFRGSWGCQDAAVGDGRLGWRQWTDADCCTSAFSWEGAGAWLRLYGLLLYSCLRTGAATCSCMPIRQAHPTHPAAAGSMPTVFSTSAPAHFSASRAVVPAVVISVSRS